MGLRRNTLLDIAPKVFERLNGSTDVFDIGPGIRPCVFAPVSHTCVEPFEGYASVLRNAGFTVLQMTAIEALESLDMLDTVLLLDVIEHMDRSEGERVRDFLESKTRQALVFTPFGFMKQTGDAWGLGGDYWQEHRSGWVPEDFPAWEIHAYGAAQGIHESFFALKQ
jgi:hypothetical protein